jgi:hypothetical protein
MDYNKALERFSECYKDRYSVEFPMILKLCDFKNKSILEISPAEGYFVNEVSKIASKVTISEISEKLPFHDKSFEIVFSRWIAQNIDKLEKAVKEMCRVAKSNVIIVLPSEEGDETKMLEIKFPDKFECRKKRIINIKKWISESDFKVKEEKRLLKFLFPNIEESIDIFSALSFKKKLSDEEKIKLKEFFLNKKKKDGIHFTQGTSFICGTRVFKI